MAHCLKKGDKVVSDVRGCKVLGVVAEVYGNGMIDVNVTNPPRLGLWKMVSAGSWKLVEPLRRRCDCPPRK